MKTLLKLISIIILTCSITYAPKGTYATVTDTTQRVQYTATADQTLFAYTWRILDQDDMDVYVNGVISTAYSVSNVGVASGGNITFNSGRTSSDIIVIIRNIPETQETSYPASGRLSTVNLEKNLDKLTLIVQDLEEEVDRATKLPATSTQSNVDFPEGSSATDRATKVPAWNSAGTGLELIASTNVDATSVIATQGDLVIGSSSGAAAKLAIGNAGEILTVSSGSPVWIQSRKAAWKKGTDIVGTTTTTIDIPDEDANYFDVTGTSTIVAIESVGTGSLVRFHFDELGTLTHHDTDLVLPGSSTIRYLKGDEFTFYEYQSGDYRLVASGQKLDPKITSVSAAYTAVTADEVILGSSTVGADFTITLYPLAGIANSELTVINVGTRTITIDGNASELIDGATTQTILTREAKTLITDGVEWFSEANVGIQTDGNLGSPTASVITFTGTSTATPVANTITKDHLIGAKCNFDGTAGVPVYAMEINFSGAITDNGAGNYTLTIDRDFADTDYVPLGSVGGAEAEQIEFNTKAVGSIIVITVSAAGGGADNSLIGVVLIGDQ